MKYLDEHTVELAPNEQWVKDAYEDYLDEGMGIVAAAEAAFIKFAECYPSSCLVQYLGEPAYAHDPFTAELFAWLVGIGNDDAQWEKYGGGWPNFAGWLREDPIEANMHFTAAMLELIYEAGVWNRPEPGSEAARFNANPNPAPSVDER